VQRVQRGEAGSRSQSLWGDEIETSLSKRAPTEAHAKDVEKFFQTHAAPKATKKIEQMLEEIRALAKFRARNATALKAHFGRNA
jgi:hypothetical protein